AQRLKFRLNLYELKEGRQIKPQTFMSMVSNLLYERSCPWRDPMALPGVLGWSLLGFWGAPVTLLRFWGAPHDHAGVSGRVPVGFLGCPHSPAMVLGSPHGPAITISQAMLNAVDRDAISGMGVVVHVIEKDKITTRTLKARMD
ncbi:PSB3 protein, partial [Polioptila caerulea]|nr:PSB3 protein [Polioptila caerulea]